MTDHKAEWPTEAKHVGSGDWYARTALAGHHMSEAQAQVWNACLAACKRTALTAAPAASEGEDGAVAWIVPSARVTSDGSYEDGPESLVFESEATDYIRRIGAPLYTRPAAQVAFTEADGVALRSIKVGEVLTQEQWDSICAFVREGEAVLGARNNRVAELESELAAQVAATPKHDEGREILEVVAKYVGRTSKIYEYIRDDLAALTTQPAARRVTDADVDAAYGAWCDVYYNADHNSREAVRAALESFAQPAEGVSRSDRDFPGDAEHENGDYENRCVQCDEVFTGYKRRVVCRVCAEKRGDAP